MTNGQAATPTSTAIAKFRSIPVENADGRRNAAADAVAEVLAELLFIPKEQISMQASLARIGIDSLIASELRKEVDELFDKEISTGWLLSGEVKVADIVDVVLES
jgi:acyl carrier protein